MDNAVNNNGHITSNTTFMAFAESHGRALRAGEYHNSKTGEPFVALAFPNSGEKGLLVSVSSKLGNFSTKEELAAFVLKNKDNLQVVQIDNPDYEKPLFSLCWQAQNTVEINLFG